METIKTFTTEKLITIIDWLQENTAQLKAGDTISLIVPDPDVGSGLFGGEMNRYGMIHRSWKNWVDLAETMDCRILKPEAKNGHLVILHFQKLNESHSWHKSTIDKYSTDSQFARIDKTEESGFIIDYLAALKRLQLQKGAAILNLGVNTGEEFAVIRHAVNEETYRSFSFTGIDLDASAIAQARTHLNTQQFHFIQGDINQLTQLNPGQFDVVISIGTLHSPGIDRQAVLRTLMQHCLKPQAAVIFAFPNCRYIDGEMKYGAKVKNYSEPELSLLIKDVAFYKKYLQQHHFKVNITGKYYIFITAKRV